LLFIDECFLHGGDVCGYTWGKSNERVVLPVGNAKQRQTFYGALDALTGIMPIMPYPQADQENTTDFLDELRYRYPKEATLTICWDNARWHRSHAVRSSLAERNDGVAQTEWSPMIPRRTPLKRFGDKAKWLFVANV
jgi:hypothetical protein